MKAFINEEYKKGEPDYSLINEIAQKKQVVLHSARLVLTNYNPMNISKTIISLTVLIAYVCL